MFWLLLLIALCIWSIYYKWERRRIHEIYNKLPKVGMKSYPIIGHAYIFGRTNEERMAGLKTLAQRTIEGGGITSLWMANRLYISVCDPDTAGVVLKHCPDKDDTTMRILRTFTGNGSVFAQVNVWRPRRKILAPVFSMKNLHGFTDEFIRQSTIMSDLLEQEIGKDGFSMWKYFTTYSFDTICKNTLGIELNSQVTRNHPFMEVFEQVTALAGTRVISPWLYSDLIYRLLPESKKFRQYKKVVYDIIDNLVKLKREEIAALEAKNETVQNKTFLDMLIETSGKTKGYSDVELREEVLVITTAGSDTSAVGASYIAVMLSRFPEVQEKVYQELIEVMGNVNRPVEAEDLGKLVYLEAVAKETLRLYPPIPIFVRETHSDCKLPNGLTVPKGVGFIFTLHGMHRNPKYWGDDAEQFRPERFLEGPLPHPIQYIPFSYSVRNCLGGTYALISIKAAISTMLLRYRLLPPAGLDPQQREAPLSTSFDIMMRHVDNYTMRLEYRNKDKS